MEKLYKEGLDMGQFKHLELVSGYNFNYYVGFGNDLLFGMSDDDAKTEWWLLSGIENKYLGESSCDNDKLNRYDKPQA
jgi:hypothetical protein